MDDIIDQIAVRILKENKDASSFVVGVGGPGGTGKTTFAKKLSKKLDNSIILSTDDYRFSRESRQVSGLKGSNPDANKIDLLISHLKDIKRGKEFVKPVYNHSDGTDSKTELFQPEQINLCEGELVMADAVIDFFDLLIYLDSEPETQLKSRMKRDSESKDLNPEEVKKLFYESNVKDFNKYYLHNKLKADIFVFVNGDYKYSIVS